MNYLAHSYLSFNHTELLVGNMMGDFIKGKSALGKFPEGIQRGLMLHRKIDTFTDSHRSVQRAKNYFRGRFGLYSGAIVDVINDYFLANDPHCFENEKALFVFTQHVYQEVSEFLPYFADGFQPMFDKMKEQNWLYHYRTLPGIQKSLKGLQARTHGGIVDIAPAYTIFIEHFYILNQCYYELIDDLEKYVRSEIE